jgi:hypothetical protein
MIVPDSTIQFLFCGLILTILMMFMSEHGLMVALDDWQAF